jgi:hypothetical protein
LKRQLVYVGDFNLSLVLRQMLGAGTPRELKNRFGKLFMAMLWLFWRGNPQRCIPRSRILAFAANYWRTTSRSSASTWRVSQAR